VNDEREAKLPQWARELIKELRQRVQYATEPLVKEAADLRRQCQLNQAKAEAMTELLDCAARGGHKTATEIMEVLRSYSLTLTPDE
jgi:hypothetical protein